MLDIAWLTSLHQHNEVIMPERSRKIKGHAIAFAFFTIQLYNCFDTRRTDAGSPIYRNFVIAILTAADKMPKVALCPKQLFAFFARQLEKFPLRNG
jgi:hypothetical protein